MRSSLLVLLAVIGSAAAASKNLVTLQEENWTQLLKGEWMLELLVLAFLKKQYLHLRHLIENIKNWESPAHGLKNQTKL